MRSFVQILLAALLATAGPAFAQESDLLGGGASTLREPTQRDRAVESALPEAAAADLEEWFDRLASAKSPMEAHGAEQQIVRRWAESGSATVDLLMSWAAEAMEEKNHARVLDLLDQVIVMKPDFAEGYNRRATVYFAMGDVSRSFADIERTLALEPRHFGALSGLGTVLMEIGDRSRAEEIYRRALAIHPQLTSVKEALDKLEAEDAGRPI